MTSFFHFASLCAFAALFQMTHAQFSDLLCKKACKNVQLPIYKRLCDKCVQNPPLTVNMCTTACQEFFISQNRIGVACNYRSNRNCPGDVSADGAEAFGSICNSCLKDPPCNMIDMKRQCLDGYQTEYLEAMCTACSYPVLH